MLDGGHLPEIKVETLNAWLGAGEAVTLLDVREPWEVDLCALPGAITIPLGTLPARIGALPDEVPIVVVCHHGLRSAQAASWLRAQGLDRVFNLAGGIDAWARRVDPSMKVY